MKNETHYANGQKMIERKGNVDTHFYKDGSVRAKGKRVKGSMEGRWLFYRGTGQLWVVGNFKGDKKHGPWVRYDRRGKEEYRETFSEGKVI